MEKLDDINNKISQLCGIKYLLKCYNVDNGSFDTNIDNLDKYIDSLLSGYYKFFFDNGIDIDKEINNITADIFNRLGELRSKVGASIYNVLFDEMLAVCGSNYEKMDKLNKMLGLKIRIDNLSEEKGFCR